MFEQKLYRTDMIRCTLCAAAPCSAACGKIDCAALLRSIWFADEKAAASRFPAVNPCIGCPAPCEKACVRPGEVPIASLMTRLHDEVQPELEVPVPEDEHRLRTEMCGVPLENPFLLSSSVVASNYDMCSRAFEAGWGGVAFKTICSFEIHEASPRYSAISGSSGTIIGFKNIEQLSDHSVAKNMEIFRALKAKYPTKFILASIMGQYDDEWEELARCCEDNGADAIELNFSCPNMAEGGLGSDIGQVPALVERFTAAARHGTKLPILAKLTPNVAVMSPAAEAALYGGADGIAAINTIKSIVGVNPHTYVSSPAVHGMSAVGGYSGCAVRPIALRFLAELGQNPKLKGMHLSGMGGIETWQDALEFILLGAGTVQVTTAVMQLHRLRPLQHLVCRRRPSGHPHGKGRKAHFGRGPMRRLSPLRPGLPPACDSPLPDQEREKAAASDGRQQRAGRARAPLNGRTAPIRQARRDFPTGLYITPGLR